MQIDLDKIRPSPFQPRLEFDLEDLKGSIIKDGILVPLTVRRLKDEHYELIDGERRLRLAKELGYEAVSCEVIEVDDETADRMVWKVNTLRKDYKPKEKALHYKRRQEAGMSLRGIAEAYDTDDKSVRAHINVFKLPDKYQKLVWNGPLSVSHIQELSGLLNGSAVTTAPVIEKLDQVIAQKLTIKELRQVIRPELEEIEKKRIKVAQEATKNIEPQIKIETPEDYERAAEALRREAKKRREAELTPQQKMEIQAKKQREEEEKKRKQELKKEQENIRIRKEAEEIAKRDLLEDEKFREEVKSDLSRSDVEGIKAIENDSILTEQDKKTLIGLIQQGEVRGGEQIKRWHQTYRAHRTEVPKLRPEQEMKRREIEEHLLDIAKGGEHLANLIMMLAGQVSSYPETLEFFPPKETMKANSAMADLRRAIRDYHEKCEIAKSKLGKQGVLKEI